MRVFNTAITLAGASKELLPPNPQRVSALLVNDDADNVIYIRLLSDAVANEGIRLNAAGGSYEINQVNPFYGRVFAIGTGKILVTEVSW